MSFDKRGVTFGRGQYNNFGSEESIIMHYYKTPDTLATVKTASYFPSFLGGEADNVKDQDMLMVSANDGVGLYRLGAVSTVVALSQNLVVSQASQDVTLGTLTLTESLILPAISPGTASPINSFERKNGISMPFGTGPVATPFNITLNIQQLNDQVSLNIFAKTAAATGTDFFQSSIAIDERFRPASDILHPFIVEDNTGIAPGVFKLTSLGIIEIQTFAAGGLFVGAGNAGWPQQTVTYRIVAP